jgi:hypothetical protein
MNGENNHIFHTSALDGVIERSEAGKFSAPLISAQLWLLAAFGALSVAAIAISAFVTGEGPLAMAVVLAAAGLALFPVMLRNAARALDRAEPDHDEPLAPLASELRFALHR